MGPWRKSSKNKPIVFPEKSNQGAKVEVEIVWGPNRQFETLGISATKERSEKQRSEKKSVRFSPLGKDRLHKKILYIMQSAST